MQQTSLGVYVGFNPTEYHSYENSLKYYRDLKNSLDTAREEGEIKGRLEEKLEIAKNLKLLGLPIETIIQSTGLTLDEISQL